MWFCLFHEYTNIHNCRYMYIHVGVPEQALWGSLPLGWDLRFVVEDKRFMCGSGVWIHPLYYGLVSLCIFGPVYNQFHCAV